LKRFAALALLLLALSACSSPQKGSAGATFTDAAGVDILWGYEQALRFNLSDPSMYVTGIEKQWLNNFLADKAAGKKPSMPWRADGAVLKVEKASKTEAISVVQFDEGETTYTVRFKFEPVNGEWKLANHQTLDGVWWSPVKKG